MSLLSFIYNDPSTTAIYTLSLHDALPIFAILNDSNLMARVLATNELSDRIGKDAIEPLTSLLESGKPTPFQKVHALDRKSTRLNSSHRTISYAVFCLKKKTTT